MFTLIFADKQFFRMLFKYFLTKKTEDLYSSLIDTFALTKIKKND